MPPFQPKATVPAPAPTVPSSTSPSDARSSAVRTWPAVIGRDRIALSPPSLVSPTTGLIEKTFPMPGWSRSQPTMASAAFQTHSVQVRRIGVSSSPSSATWTEPRSLP